MRTETTAEAGTDLVESGTEGAQLEALLASLNGGGVYASVFRVEPDREDEFLPGKLPVPATADLPELLESLSKRHGPGTYNLQFRKSGQRGTVGNATVRVGGTRVAMAEQRSEELPRYVREVLEQNRELIAALKDTTRPAAPVVTPEQMMSLVKNRTPAAELGELMALAERFRESAGVGTATVAPGVSGWAAFGASLGQALGPAAGELARVVIRAAAAGPGITRVPPPVNHAPGPAVAETAPPIAAAAAAPPAEDLPADETPALSADEQASSDGAKGLLIAATRAARPLPHVYAAALWDLDAPRLRELVATTAKPAIAELLGQVAPGLKEKGSFLTDLEHHIRELAK